MNERSYCLRSLFIFYVVIVVLLLPCASFFFSLISRQTPGQPSKHKHKHKRKHTDTDTFHLSSMHRNEFYCCSAVQSNPIPCILYFLLPCFLSPIFASIWTTIGSLFFCPCAGKPRKKNERRNGTGLKEGGKWLGDKEGFLKSLAWAMCALLIQTQLRLRSHPLRPHRFYLHFPTFHLPSQSVSISLSLHLVFSRLFDDPSRLLSFINCPAWDGGIDEQRTLQS